MTVSNTTPVFAVDEKHLIPVSDHLHGMTDILLTHVLDQ